jgi:hypothetical protein
MCFDERNTGQARTRRTDFCKLEADARGGAAPRGLAWSPWLAITSSCPPCGRCIRFVLHALALVGLGTAISSDFGSHLADLLLVDALTTMAVGFGR